MGKVALLPSDLANQIAAGEVVERPAAVLKELVENALDAGARRIDISAERGGMERLAVVDDGEGMSAEDAELSLSRHATSKIASVSDLQAITTFGFRGEALPSIAAVSRFTLTTRRAEDDAATRLTVEGGGQAERQTIAAPSGTEVSVEDLFFNVPARKKFLRRVATESSRLVDMTVRLALSNPEVAFSLKEDGRSRLRAAATKNLADRATAILGLATARALLPLDRDGSVVKVRGLVSPPEVSRSNSSGIYLFVNGRYVKDRRLQGALVAAYRRLLDRGRFPVAVLFMEVDPMTVDVNVHPAKHEVRFSNEAAVSGSLVEAVRGVLNQAPWVESEASPGRWGRPSSADPERVIQLSTGTPSFTEASDRMAKARAVLLDGGPRRSAENLHLPMFDGVGERRYFRGLRYLGSVHATYLVCAGENGLVLVDQHAAHERIVFERVLAGIERGSVPVQPLLIPRKLDLDPALYASWEDMREDLESLGVETEAFGGRTVLLKALPVSFGEQGGEGFLRELVEDRAGRGPAGPCGRPRTIANRLEALAASVACHGSVRAGQILSEGEARALLEQLDAVENAGNCPHGRPTFVGIDERELERRFGRR